MTKAISVGFYLLWATTCVKPYQKFKQNVPDLVMQETTGETRLNTARRQPLALYQESPKVRTTSGLVIGKNTSYALAFFSIPYAKPPVGKLRFQDPEPLYEVSNTLNCSEPYRVACYQPILRRNCTSGSCKIFSENCLVLNVFVPAHVNLANPNKPPRHKLPVMFWIHGGGFFSGAGTSSMYDGRFLSQITNTIIVTINYRLGPLGFLVYDDGINKLQGNQGLKDQQLALKWVQNNIQNFGGDRARVTIFGESAGAQSVMFHLVSDISDPFFTRAIMDSNPAVYNYSSPEEAGNVTKKLIQQIRCKDEIIPGKVCCQKYITDFQCLIEISPKTLIEGMEKMMAEHLINLEAWDIIEPFRPHVDGNEFKTQPLQTFKEGKWQTTKPVIIGTNAEELDVLKYFNPFDFAIGPDIYKELNVGIFGKELGLAVTKKYESMNSNITDYGLLFGNQMTDVTFACPSRALARFASATTEKEVHLYVFSHGMSKEDCELFFKHFEKELCGHSYHGAEIPFLFQSVKHLGIIPDGYDVVVSDQFATYWGSFARTGSPNNGLEKPLPGYYPTWDTYKRSPQGNGPQNHRQLRNKDSRSWKDMRFDVPVCHVENDYKADICNFWDSVNFYGNLYFGMDLLQAMSDAIKRVQHQISEIKNRRF